MFLSSSRHDWLSSENQRSGHERCQVYPFCLSTILSIRNSTENSKKKKKNDVFF